MLFDPSYHYTKPNAFSELLLLFGKSRWDHNTKGCHRVLPEQTEIESELKEIFKGLTSPEILHAIESFEKKINRDGSDEFYIDEAMAALKPIKNHHYAIAKIDELTEKSGSKIDEFFKNELDNITETLSLTNVDAEKISALLTCFQNRATESLAKCIDNHQKIPELEMLAVNAKKFTPKLYKFTDDQMAKIYDLQRKINDKLVVELLKSDHLYNDDNNEGEVQKHNPTCKL